MALPFNEIANNKLYNIVSHVGQERAFTKRKANWWKLSKRSSRGPPPQHTQTHTHVIAYLLMFVNWPLLLPMAGSLFISLYQHKFQVILVTCNHIRKQFVLSNKLQEESSLVA